MTSQEDITSVTLGELTLLLLFSTLIIFFFTLKANNISKISISEKVNKISNLQQEKGELLKKIKRQTQTLERQTQTLEALQLQMDRLKEINTLQKARINNLLGKIKLLKKETKLRSRQKPTCKEIGIADGYLANLVIAGRDKFVMGRQTINSDELLEMLSQPLALANKYKCVHLIKVEYDPTITLQEYENGMKKLERHFYVKKMGAHQ